MQSILNRVFSLFILVFLNAAAFAQTRVITSVAGNGTAGLAGDAGPATSAILHGPSEVTIDSAGNFYIADRKNNRIRRVDIGTGVITTVAGSGVAGWYFEGGPALISSLDNPSGVAVDATGNLYIADLLDTGISR